ncbi:MAG: hypothetical protein ACTSRU_20445 [Candidatus Hodarchaeales archaeon]
MREREGRVILKCIFCGRPVGVTGDCDNGINVLLDNTTGKPDLLDIVDLSPFETICGCGAIVVHQIRVGPHIQDGVEIRE